MDQQIFDLIFIHGNENYRYKDHLDIIHQGNAYASSQTILWVDNYHLPGVYRAVSESVRKGIIKIEKIYTTKDALGKFRTCASVKYCS